MSDRTRSRSRGKRRFSIVTVGLLVSAVIGSGTFARAAPAPGGGIPLPPSPQIDSIICLTGCVDLGTSSRGGTVQIGGRALSAVRWVSFVGESNRVRTAPIRATETTVVARIPAGALSGRVRVVTTGGSSAAMSRSSLAIRPAPRVTGPDTPLRLIDASTAPGKAYLFGAAKPRVDFVVAGGASSTVRLDVLDREGAVVASRLLEKVARNSTSTFTWNMKTSAGRNAAGGSYRFRIADPTGTPAELAPRLASRSLRGSLGFTVHGFIFPVRGPHSYGDGIGAGRGHQGGDVAASCGTPLVAARGGRVHYNSYQASGAGHYLVINLSGTRNESHVYMHLERPSPAKVGSLVKTGQRIGTVGTTGRSTGCHLHFEHWSAPGWYQGGSFLDPMGRLRKWDTYS